MLLGMSGIFNNCSVFNQDLSSWIVSNVTDMFAMFQPVVYLIVIYRVGL